VAKQLTGWMPFGVVNRVGRRMGVLDGGGDRRREGIVLGVNVGQHGSSKLLWEDLLYCCGYITGFASWRRPSVQLRDVNSGGVARL